MSWSEDDGSSQRLRVSRPFAKTLHDFSLRIVQRAGRHFVKDKHGNDLYYYNTLAFDRTRRYVKQTCYALYDVFEQKTAWRGQVFVVRFDTVGQWELELLVQGGSVVIAYGHFLYGRGDLVCGRINVMQESVVGFQVADLPGFLSRMFAQFRLRQEYHHHLLS